MKKVIFLLLISIAVLALLYMSKRSKENFNGKTTIGNNLSLYFRQMAIAWRDGEKYVCDLGFKDDEFYEHLPQEIDPPPDFPKISDSIGEWDDWTCDNKDTVDLWKAMSPYISKMLDEALEKSGLKIDEKNPVIHFRCSDVPFNRHPEYHLQKYEFFKKALGDYKGDIDLINCSTHLSSDRDQEMCKTYIEYLQKELGTNINVQCGTILEDFAKMFYAPICISSGSSMSFFAGYFGKGTFYTGGNFKEGEEGSECLICDLGKFELLHSDVNDYYDMKEVHDKLL